MNNKRPGLTITRGPGQGAGPPPAKAPRRMAPTIPKGANILASGEVVSLVGRTEALQPCTPYCPGELGFPDLECTHCGSLFHPKCVGVPEAAVNRIRSTFRCRICTPQQQPMRAKPGPKPGPKRTKGNNVTVIDLD